MHISNSILVHCVCVCVCVCCTRSALILFSCHFIFAKFGSMPSNKIVQIL